MNWLEEKIALMSDQIKALRRENRALRKKADAFDAVREQIRKHGEAWMAGKQHTAVSLLCIDLADQMDAVEREAGR